MGSLPKKQLSTWRNRLRLGLSRLGVVPAIEFFERVEIAGRERGDEPVMFMSLDEAHQLSSETNGHPRLTIRRSDFGAFLSPAARQQEFRARQPSCAGRW